MAKKNEVCVESAYREFVRYMESHIPGHGEMDWETENRLIETLKRFVASLKKSAK